jgi:DNA-binding SARP family transcriptional activator
MTIRIQVLGHPLIEVDGKRRRLAGRKPWALLAFLLLESTPPSRRELAERLWPEADDPLRAVRWALLQIRRAIAPALVEEVDGRLRIAQRSSFYVDADASCGSSRHDRGWCLQPGPCAASAELTSWAIHSDPSQSA